jgi:hypothetical protein
MNPACGYFAVALLSLLTPAAHAKVIDQEATIAGLPLHYKVVLPKDYDATKAYPAVLAFPPGSQTMDMVQTTLVQNWAREAQKRGYIVVIPGAPNGRLFHEDGARVFPEFLNKLLSDYKIRDNKFHIAGMSNGGISAFYVAASYPSFFSSVSGFPGYLPEASPERLKSPGDNAVLWRYCDLPKLVSLLSKKALYFSVASALGDHFEGAMTRELAAWIPDRRLARTKPHPTPGLHQLLARERIRIGRYVAALQPS